MLNPNEINQIAAIVSDNITQRIDVTQLAAALSQGLNENIPAAQVRRAIKRYDMSFMPGVRTWSYTAFAAVSALSGVQQIQIDAGFGYFFNAIAGWVIGEADTDSFIQSIQINSGTNFLSEPMPFGLTTRYTGAPLTFCFYAPPTTGLQIELKNGSTTANPDFYLTFFGYKLPASDIEKIRNS